MTRSWRVALRLARRDALRNRGRSVLVLVMIALPVLGVTAADVVLATQGVSSLESLDRTLGAADAEVTEAGVAPVVQDVDPDRGLGWTTPEGVDTQQGSLTQAQLSAALGGAELLPVRHAAVDVRTDHGVRSANATEVDLRDPLTSGIFRRTSGRWPASAGEVVVNRAVLDEGYAVGDALDLDADGAPSPTIVGVVESGESRTYPVVAGPTGSLGLDPDDARASWLVGGGPVSWAAVQAVNRVGGTVLSRAVVTDPPPQSEIPDEVRARMGGDGDDQAVVVVGLVAAMALLEVVLLAGPAFAVTARRQARTLALLGATGGTPAQSRRVIVGGGVVLGLVAAGVGVVVGIVLGWALVPVAQHYSDQWFGPFDVPWLHLAGIALFGLASAVLASVVPAVIASRQDVVAVLAGRRADRRPSLRSPILGVVLLGLGVAGSAYGAVVQPGLTLLIPAAAIAAVIGMLLLVPIVVVGIARISGRLPLSTRYAARDAARHRTRTVPAVAAVAATVAGVVALGIGVTSDEAENRETYQASLPDGMGLITTYGDAPDWPAMRAAAEHELPGAALTPVRGVREQGGDDTPSYYLEVKAAGADYLRSNTGGSWGTSNLVGTRVLADPALGLDGAQQAAAAGVLRRGGVVAFSDRGLDVDEVKVVAHRWDPGAEKDIVTRAGGLPAIVIPVASRSIGPQAVLSEAAARRVGVPVGLVGYSVSGDVTPDQQQAATEALTAADLNSSLYVERGYQTDDETVVTQLVLAALGGVLMLGGTLTATFLALSDARPDLATLAAVGASPRRRRTIAASYALVVGFVGAVLGAAVGFIPGLAVTYPLTHLPGDTCIVSGSGSCTASGVGSGPFIDVPWLMVIGLVVALPLVTAAVVGLCARSRLPLAARLD